ncbi:MAG: dihydroneopterin aldolase [Bacteroidales bacterium]|nr:dihydroneopterin aldolase [Bacteroidales bacterium]
MGQIKINGLKIYAHHGVLDQERRVGNTFVVDLVLDVPDTEEAEHSDDLKDTINYAEVIALVQEVMGEPKNLLERVAGAIILRLKAAYPSQLAGGSITISKLAPPIPAELVSVSYTTEF